MLGGCAGSGDVVGVGDILAVMMVVVIRTIKALAPRSEQRMQTQWQLNKRWSQENTS